MQWPSNSNLFTVCINSADLRGLSREGPRYTEAVLRRGPAVNECDHAHSAFVGRDLQLSVDIIERSGENLQSDVTSHTACLQPF